jgi:thiamine kinase-like enzyme
MIEDQVSQIFHEKTGKKTKSVRKLNGLSNHVFKVRDEDNQLWIFKILLAESKDPFKKMERIAINLVADMENAKVYDDHKYRIERFIPNEDTTLEQVMSPLESLKIMRAISEFNQLSCIEADSPNIFHLLRKDSPMLFAKINANLQKVGSELRSEFTAMLLDVEAITNKLHDAYKFDSLVLSHNDLFYRNIILDSDKNRYVLIDFEYAGYNPFGMDVFQFVNEFLIDYNHPEPPFFKLQMDQYPKEAYLRELIRFYFFFWQHKELVADMPDSDSMLDFVRASPEFKAIEEKKVSEILGLFPYFGVITNMFWFYWGLYLFKVENISLDYVEFSKAKYQMIKYFQSQLTQ